MSSEGLTLRIAEEARITGDQAFEALAAAFQGFLGIASPYTYQGKTVEVLISVNPPPTPNISVNPPPTPNISVNPPPTPNISVNPPPTPNISVNPPPTPNFLRSPKTRTVHRYADIIKFIADSADIPTESAAAALGVIAQAIVEGAAEAGLRAYYEFEPPKPQR